MTPKMLSDIMQWFLIIASLISCVSSIIFLSLFSFPHSPEIPVVESWQRIGPEIISNLYTINDIGTLDEDMSLELLLSVSSMIGSLGYDKATFYMAMSPYWNTMIIVFSLFALLMVLSSMVMIFYLLFSLRLKDRFCLAPWIFQHILIEIAFFIMLVILLMDISNTARVKLEIQNGDGGIFAMVVTGLIAATVDVFLCIMGQLVRNLPVYDI